MHKELIIVIIIVVLIIAGNIITQNYTKNSVHLIQKELNETKEYLSKKEEEKLKEKIKSVEDKWNKKKDKLTYYIEHDELEKIEEELTAVSSNIETNSYEQGIECLDRCIFLLEHVKNKETMELRNIF